MVADTSTDASVTSARDSCGWTESSLTRGSGRVSRVASHQMPGTRAPTEAGQSRASRRSGPRGATLHDDPALRSRGVGPERFESASWMYNSREPPLRGGFEAAGRGGRLARGPRRRFVGHGLGTGELSGPAGNRYWFPRLRGRHLVVRRNRRAAPLQLTYLVARSWVITLRHAHFHFHSGDGSVYT